MALRIPEVITEEELKKLLSAEKVKPHHKAAFALAFYGCLRVSEVCKLQPEDVDTNLKQIKIRQSKRNKDRIIPLPPEVKSIQKFLPFNLTPRALEIAFKKACKQVLGKDLHFHCLRHSGITHYIKKGWSTLEVARLAGHSRVTTTEIYTHLKVDDLISKMWQEDKR